MLLSEFFFPMIVVNLLDELHEFDLCRCAMSMHMVVLDLYQRSGISMHSLYLTSVDIGVDALVVLDLSRCTSL